MKVEGRRSRIVFGTDGVAETEDLLPLALEFFFVFFELFVRVEVTEGTVAKMLDSKPKEAAMGGPSERSNTGASSGRSPFEALPVVGVFNGGADDGRRLVAGVDANRILRLVLCKDILGAGLGTEAVDEVRR